MGAVARDDWQFDQFDDGSVSEYNVFIIYVLDGICNKVNPENSKLPWAII